jgi:hypothetical protein
MAQRSVVKLGEGVVGNRPQLLAIACRSLAAYRRVLGVAAGSGADEGDEDGRHDGERRHHH